MKFIKQSSLALAILTSGFSAESMAAGQSAFLQAEGQAKLSFSYNAQSADEFFLGDDEMDLPADLEQDNFGLSLSYGITEALSLDVNLGYGRSDFIVAPGLAPEGGLSGLSDARIGLRYGLWQESQSAVTLNAGLLIEGDYDTGALPAIGDGGSGLEISVLAANQFESGFGLGGELGYRTRNNDVPDEWFFLGQAWYAFNDSVSAVLGYQIVESDGDLDIGGDGFSPARFPEVDEDYDLWFTGLNFQINQNWDVGVNYGAKLDGSNTAKSSFWGLAFGYQF